MKSSATGEPEQGVSTDTEFKNYDIQRFIWRVKSLSATCELVWQWLDL